MINCPGTSKKWSHGHQGWRPSKRVVNRSLQLPGSQEGLHRRSSIAAEEQDRKFHRRSIKISSTGASLQVIGEAPSRDKLELRLSKLNCEISLCFNEVKVQVDDRGVLT